MYTFHIRYLNTAFIKYLVAYKSQGSATINLFLSTRPLNTGDRVRGSVQINLYYDINKIIKINYINCYKDCCVCKRKYFEKIN